MGLKARQSFRKSIKKKKVNERLYPKSSQFEIINGITFPVSADQPLFQPGDYSYCDYFWEDTPEGKSGLEVLCDQKIAGRNRIYALADFLSKRQAASQKFAASLEQLAKANLPVEFGTMAEALTELKNGFLEEARTQQKFANKIGELVGKMKAYDPNAESALKKKKKVVNKNRKNLFNQTKEIAKVRSNVLDINYCMEKRVATQRQNSEDRNESSEDESIEPVMKTKFDSYNDEKLRTKSRETGQELENLAKQYVDDQKNWFNDLMDFTTILQRDEEQRLMSLKEYLSEFFTKYLNLIEELKEFEKTFSEKLERVNLLEDRKLFIEKFSISSRKPVDFVL